MSDSITAYKGCLEDLKPSKIHTEFKTYPKKPFIIEQLESEYPEIADEFKSIMANQYELFAQKMLSYGMGNISMGTNLETKEDTKLSLTAIWIRMNDKMNRLKNLVLLNNKNPLDNEPTIDAWIDMVNYSIIAQIVTKGKWKK
jgi:hypothetical protein